MGADDVVLERLRAGRLAIVVGAGLGAAGHPAWPDLLARMADKLPPDQRETAARALAQGRLAAAAGFLERRLGARACADILKAELPYGAAPPAAMAVLARLPVQVFISGSPGHVLERALAAHAGAGVKPQVITARELELVPATRVCVKALGSADRAETLLLSVVAARKLVQDRAPLRRFLEDLWRSSTLLFVGFAADDPDLALLLDGLFAFAGNGPRHQLVVSAPDPLLSDELAARGVDTVTIEGGLDAWLETLAEGAAGAPVRPPRPASDDVEAWFQRWADNRADPSAVRVLGDLQRHYREQGDHEKLVDLLLKRVEHTAAGPRRARLLFKVARVFELELSDTGRAFTTLCHALADDPGSDELLNDLERLAALRGSWPELATEAAALVGQLHEPEAGARLWTRLGNWYARHLDHADYAVAAYRQAVLLHPAAKPAWAPLQALYRSAGRWQDLVDSLQAQLVHLTQPAELAEALLSLGDVHDSELKDPRRAIAAFQQALAATPDNPAAQAALERLCRREERWEELAAGLERRADQTADPVRRAALHCEIAEIRIDRLRDLIGGIAQLEAAVRLQPDHREALRALPGLYEHVGDAEGQLRALGRLADIATSVSERMQTFRRMAAVLESEGHAGRATDFLELVLKQQPDDDDAFRSLARLYEDQRRYEQLIDALTRRAQHAATPAAGAALWTEIGRVYDERLQDGPRAIRALDQALALEPNHAPALSALTGLYRRTESWDRAVEMLVRGARRAEGAAAVALWHEAGELAVRVPDRAAAEAHFAKALELHAHHLPSLLALAQLYRDQGENLRTVQLLCEAEAATQNRLEKVRLLHEAGVLCEDQLGNPERAAGLYARVLALDPEHVDASRRLADLWFAASRWRDVAPILAMLVGKIDPADRLEASRRLRQLARAQEGAGDDEGALRHYREALATQPGDHEAMRGLADFLFRRAEYGEAETLYQALASRQPAPADPEATLLAYRQGKCANARGDRTAARAAFQRALAISPNHAETLAALADEAQAEGNPATIVASKLALLSAASPEQRFKLHVEIADLYLRELDDPVSAHASYLEARALKPKSQSLLHKLVELYVEQKKWKRAIETLGELVDVETDRVRRSRYRFTIATIHRDQLQANDQAIQTFEQVLDDAPEDQRTFDAIRELLTSQADWARLVKCYRRQLKRLASAGPRAVLPYWIALSDLELDKLGDREAAIVALEVAVALDPESEQRSKLATLYAEGGAKYTDKAIAEQHRLLVANPDRFEGYRTLARLYREAKRIDEAYCVTAGLRVLNGADAEDERFFASHKPQPLGRVDKPVTEELWLRGIVHPRQDARVSAILAALSPALIALTAQPHEVFGVRRKDAIDLTKDNRPLAKQLASIALALGLPLPELYVRSDQREPLKIANTRDRGLARPAFLVGPSFVDEGPRELAFELARRTMFLRRDCSAVYALGTAATLRHAFQAALWIASGQQPAEVGPEIDRLRGHLQQALTPPVVAQVAELARGLPPSSADGKIVFSWLSGVEHTANRVGFVIANDLATATRKLAREPLNLTTASEHERTRALVAYAVSEEFLALRRHLGLATA